MQAYRHDIVFPSVGRVTLTRWALKVCGHKILLHRFRAHRDLEYHDHPWPFVTFVLWGSYVDEALDTGVRDVLRPGSLRRRSALHAHRTSCTRTTWTIVVTGRHERSWCRSGADPSRTWTCED